MVENWPMSQYTPNIALIEVVVEINHEYNLVTYFFVVLLRKRKCCRMEKWSKTAHNLFQKLILAPHFVLARLPEQLAS